MASPAASSSEPVEPIELEIRQAAQQVRILWSDGHTSFYPWWYLRGFCPCAHCQGHGGPTRFIETDAIALDEVDEVGQYALRLSWEKAHVTGIYTFAYLRTLCLCGACRGAAGEAHPLRAVPATLAKRLPDLDA